MFIQIYSVHLDIEFKRVHSDIEFKSRMTVEMNEKRVHLTGVRLFNGSVTDGGADGMKHLIRWLEQN